MHVQYTPLTLPLALVVVLCLAGALIAWRQREGEAEIWALLIQVAFGLWALFTLLTLVSVTYTWKLRWFLLFVPTMPLAVVSTFFFTMQFCGHSEWLTPRRRLPFYLFPVVVLALALTNGTHGLIVTNSWLDASGTLRYHLGPGFYATMGGCYAIAFPYNVILFRKVRRSRNVYRKISFVISVTALSTLLATVVTVMGFNPFPHFTLLPLTYLVVGAVLLAGTSSTTLVRRLPVDRALSVFRSRLDSTIPLARDFVVQEVDNGIVVLDADDRVVDINATAKRMLGLDRPIGKRVTDITRVEWVLDGGDLVPVLKGEAPVRELQDQVWVESENGKRCYDVQISSLRDDDDAAAAHIILLHDITEQKEREEMLQQQTETLETQKSQLEHQNERLDEFASIVSHDLRNPLSVATGRVELLLVGADEGEEITVDRAHLAELQDAHERMADIIDDALTLARQGKAITDTESVSLETVARSAWENVSTERATLSVTSTRTIEADRARLLTIFENCFRNSLEHGRDDVTVTVGDIETGEKRGFYVADDGPGIADAHKGDVLEHGYTTSSDGTGLGLSIVTDIANAHGWSVAVSESDEGGARFEITGIDTIATERPADD